MDRLEKVRGEGGKERMASCSLSRKLISKLSGREGGGGGRGGVRLPSPFFLELHKCLIFPTFHAGDLYEIFFPHV